MKNLRLMVITLALSAVVFSVSRAAGTESDDKKNFTLSAGVKGYAEKSDDSNITYYKPFASGGLFFSHADVYASFHQWQGYSVADVSGNLKKTDISQPGLDLALYPSNFFTLTASCSYLKGDVSYRETRFKGGIEVKFSGLTLGGEYSRYNADYTFNGDNKSIDDTFYGTIEKKLTRELSVELSYERGRTKFITYGFETTDQSVRFGVLGLQSKYFSWTAGLGFGYDSDNVMSPGFDLGVIVKISDFIKISVNYLFNGDIQESTTSSAQVSGSGGGGRKSSSSVKYDTSYTHTAIAGISLYY